MLGWGGSFFAALIVVAIASPGHAQDTGCPPDGCSAEVSTEAPAKPYLPWRLQMDEAEQAPDFTAPEQRWYGWQTLVVDAAVLIAFGVAGVADETGLAFGSLGGLLIGAPLVHLANGNSRSAAISFGLRLGAALVTFSGLLLALDGAFDDSAESSDGEVTLGVIVGLIGLAGMLASIVIDPTLLAFEDVAPERERALQVVPLVDPKRGSFGLGVALQL